MEMKTEEQPMIMKFLWTGEKQLEVYVLEYIGREEGMQERMDSN